MPASTRKRGKAGDDAPPKVELVTLRNIAKRLYNTARTNFFTTIIKIFRQEAGAQLSPLHVTACACQSP